MTTYTLDNLNDILSLFENAEDKDARGYKNNYYLFGYFKVFINKFIEKYGYEKIDICVLDIIKKCRVIIKHKNLKITFFINSLITCRHYEKQIPIMVYIMDENSGKRGQFRINNYIGGYKNEYIVSVIYKDELYLENREITLSILAVGDIMEKFIFNFSNTEFMYFTKSIKKK